MNGDDKYLIKWLREMAEIRSSYSIDPVSNQREKMYEWRAAERLEELLAEPGIYFNHPNKAHGEMLNRLYGYAKDKEQILIDALISIRDDEVYAPGAAAEALEEYFK